MSNHITKTTYPSTGKVVLENEHTGIMISTEYYDELIGMGMQDVGIFEGLRRV